MPAGRGYPFLPVPVALLLKKHSAPVHRLKELIAAGQGGAHQQVLFNSTCIRDTMVFKKRKLRRFKSYLTAENSLSASSSTPASRYIRRLISWGNGRLFLHRGLCSIFVQTCLLSPPPASFAVRDNEKYVHNNGCRKHYICRPVNNNVHPEPSSILVRCRAGWHGKSGRRPALFQPAGSTVTEPAIRLLRGCANIRFSEYALFFPLLKAVHGVSRLRVITIARKFKNRVVLCAGGVIPVSNQTVIPVSY
jgi:hypothetical protein